MVVIKNTSKILYKMIENNYSLVNITPLVKFRYNRDSYREH